ncbi:MAG: alpha/beta hydrolase fold domain-containing protein [Phycisphaera sp.]|nr:alpha/beta hydrolase fold domain-containing protein [Phycisphaera sp.]
MFRSIVVALCALMVVAMSAGAAEPVRESVWPGKAPVGDGTTSDDAAYFTIVQPVKPNGTAVVICPGGGYGVLVKGPEGFGIAKWLNEHGITGVVLEYRLPRGRCRVPLLDAQRTIRTVRARAKDIGIDPNRIGIMGFSAGGHLAASASVHWDRGAADAADPIERVSCRPDFSVLIYPVVSLGPHGHGGTRRNLLGDKPSDELVKEFSSELQVTKDTPPAYLAHAKDDHVVPVINSAMYHDALKAAGVATKFTELDHGDHGLNGYKGPMWDQWQAESLVWMAEITSK